MERIDSDNFAKNVSFRESRSCLTTLGYIININHRNEQKV
jgi:hypothetical protein